jgi:hypothetical protein
MRMLDIFASVTVNCTDTVPPSVSGAGAGDAVQLSEALGDWQETVIVEV